MKGTGTQMLLALDIGNTHIHLGVFHGSELAVTWDLSNDRSRTVDEFGMLLETLLRQGGIARGDLTGAAVACVVPPMMTTVERMFRKFFDLDPFFIGPRSARDLLGSFEDPREVGADRIANAVGGYEKYGGPLIVVDFGTATTFDAVSGRGNYLGGAIAPGIAISIEALFRKAARLPRIELVRPSKAVATDTVTSMQSGIIFGYAGLVESLVRRIRSELGEGSPVIATGGMAELIVRETGIAMEIDEHLTLDGIRILYDRSRD